jgi:phage-related tail fiber protein
MPTTPPTWVLEESAESTTSDSFRRRLAAHMAGNGILKKAAFMAFGDGGHNPNNTAKAATASRDTLYHEVKRKTLTGLTQEDLYSLSATGVIAGSELDGGILSEAALLDEDGNLICWKTFPPKYLGSGESYGVKLKPRY